MFITILNSQLNVLLWALVETSCVPQKELWLKNNLMKEKSSVFPSSLKVTYMLCTWWVREELVFAGGRMEKTAFHSVLFLPASFLAGVFQRMVWEKEKETNPATPGLLILLLFSHIPKSHNRHYFRDTLKILIHMKIPQSNFLDG